MAAISLVHSSPDKLQTACLFVHNSCSPASSTLTPPLSKSCKRTRSEPPEIMRCKRRINFSNLGYPLPQAQPAAVARRNERERNRVKLVNMGFATLREHVPNGGKNKKMSKVETLKSAVEYIRQLQQLLDENDAVNAAFSDSTLSPTLPANLSPSCSVASSPTPSYSSETSSYEPLSAEDEELLDFTSWFS